MGHEGYANGSPKFLPSLGNLLFLSTVFPCVEKSVQYIVDQFHAQTNRLSGHNYLRRSMSCLLLGQVLRQPFNELLQFGQRDLGMEPNVVPKLERKHIAFSRYGLDPEMGYRMPQVRH